MTLYIAVDGAGPEALDAADDELIANTVHQLLHDEVLVQDIETVGIVEDLVDEVDGAVIDEEDLQILADVTSSGEFERHSDRDNQDIIWRAVDKAYDAL